MIYIYIINIMKNKIVLILIIYFYLIPCYMIIYNKSKFEDLL